MSKVIHNSIYDYLKLNYKYVPVEFQDNSELEKFLDTNLNNDDFFANVTFPYKKACLTYLTGKGFAATGVSNFSEGCNFICSKDKSLNNFDGEGSLMYLKHVCIDFDNVLICGTGVTAKSIYYAFITNSIHNIEFATRHNDIKNNQNISVDTYSMQNKKIKLYNLIIDATSKTISGHIDFPNMDKNAVVMDVNYSKDKTETIKEADKFGIKSVDGKGMLVAQAVLSIMYLCKCHGYNAESFEKLYNIGLSSIED